MKRAFGDFVRIKDLDLRCTLYMQCSLENGNDQVKEDPVVIFVEILGPSSMLPRRQYQLDPESPPSMSYIPGRALKKHANRLDCVGGKGMTR